MLSEVWPGNLLNSPGKIDNWLQRIRYIIIKKRTIKTKYPRFALAKASLGLTIINLKRKTMAKHRALISWTWWKAAEIVCKSKPYSKIRLPIARVKLMPANQLRKIFKPFLRSIKMYPSLFYCMAKPLLISILLRNYERFTKLRKNTNL